MKPKVAIVGRPNVGKSALFNRLIGRQLAIVEGQPYVTRDRNYSDINWNNKEIELIDTGGIDPNAPQDFRAGVLKQTRQAIKEADKLLMVVDVVTGLTPLDLEVAEILKKSGKPVILAANKSEGAKVRENLADFYSLGLGDPIPVSSLHGLNCGDLLDELTGDIETAEVPEPEEEIRVTIVGKPNVGKSSLLNALTGENRVLVDSVPGTTRDAVDAEFEFQGRKIVLVDSAGIRRKNRIEERVEFYSWVRTQKAVSNSDLVLLVIDAKEGIFAQDKKIASYIKDEGKGIIIIFNKWDLIDKDEKKQKEKEYLGHLSYLDFASRYFISALKGWNLEGLFPEVLRVFENYASKIPAKKLNNWLKTVINERPPGLGIKIRYLSQSSAKPPTFRLRVNLPEKISSGYLKFMEKRLRETFDFSGTPIRFELRG